MNRTGNAAPVLDSMFDSGALLTLREEVRECAMRSGISADRAEDMMLAIHELAANAVVHDGGAGRLRVWKLAHGRCTARLTMPIDEVPSGHPAGTAWEAVSPVVPRARSQRVSLPTEKGHGLWLVRKLADQVRTLSGPHGTRVLVAFDLSR